MRDDMKQAIDRFWWGYINNPILYELPVSEDWKGARELVNLAWQAGARWSIRTSSELSPHIARFIEMLILLGVLDENDTQVYPPRVGPADGSAGDPSVAWGHSVRADLPQELPTERREDRIDLHGRGPEPYDEWCEQTPA